MYNDNIRHHSNVDFFEDLDAVGTTLKSYEDEKDSSIYIPNSASKIDEHDIDFNEPRIKSACDEFNLNERDYQNKNKDSKTFYSDLSIINEGTLDNLMNTEAKKSVDMR
jgi:hypothetical protein